MHVVCTRSYFGDSPGSLSLRIGNRVIIETEEDGQWRGRVLNPVGDPSGKAGWFPKDVVQEETTGAAHANPKKSTEEVGTKAADERVRFVAQMQQDLQRQAELQEAKAGRRAPRLQATRSKVGQEVRDLLSAKHQAQFQSSQALNASLTRKNLSKRSSTGHTRRDRSLSTESNEDEVHASAQLAKERTHRMGLETACEQMEKQEAAYQVSADLLYVIIISCASLLD